MYAGFRFAAEQPGEYLLPIIEDALQRWPHIERVGQISDGHDQRHGQNVTHLIVQQGSPVSRFKSVSVMPKGIGPGDLFIDKAPGWLVCCNQRSPADWQSHETNGVVDDTTLLHVYR